MRLFLSSYGIGNQPEKLVSLVGVKTPRVALVSNAADYHDQPGIVERIERDTEMFSLLGMKLEPLDLKDYFGKQDKLAEKLKHFDLVWVRGGNVFILRRAMAQSGFDIEINKLLTKDSIVYGGYSAGACVLSPTLRGVELCDDPNLSPQGYLPDILWEGLGLVDFCLVPHYKSDHPESTVIDRVVEYYEHNSMPYEALRDGECIVINGTKIERFS